MILFLLHSFSSRLAHLSFFQSAHRRAVAQALLVTFLWSTSWVLIKTGLAEIPALTFAGLRYAVAFFCLLPLMLRPTNRQLVRALSVADWVRLSLLGVLLYAVTQGSQFMALAYLPAITTSLLLNFTSICVALLSLFLFAERPRPWQWLGIGLNIAGILLFFYPIDLPLHERIGLGIALLGVLANAGSALLGRVVNRGGTLPSVVVTTISMGIGAVLLLGSGLIWQPWPTLTLSNWLAIGWLAVINTAFAFTLWNQTLRTLSAVESSMINSTMLIQITLLAWFVLGERINGQEMLGLIIAGLGIFVVQWRPKQA
jgi:drug/metabolite transporter (DMT)-like permease